MVFPSGVRAWSTRVHFFKSYRPRMDSIPNAVRVTIAWSPSPPATSTSPSMVASSQTECRGQEVRVSSGFPIGAGTACHPGEELPGQRIDWFLQGNVLLSPLFYLWVWGTRTQAIGPIAPILPLLCHETPRKYSQSVDN